MLDRHLPVSLEVAGADCREDLLADSVGVLDQFAAQLFALLARDGAGGIGTRSPGGECAANEMLDVLDRLPVWVAKVPLDVAALIRVLLQWSMAEVDERVGGRRTAVDPVAVVLDQVELASVGEQAALDGVASISIALVIEVPGLSSNPPAITTGSRPGCS